MSEAGLLRRLLREPLQRRTWAETGYALLSLPLGGAGALFTVASLTVGAGLIVTFVGLPLLALTGLLSRWFGDGWRRLANRLVSAGVPPAQPFRSNPGLLGWVGSCLTDGTAWRARLYLVLKFPLAVVGFVTTLLLWVYGLGGVTYAVWRPFLPCQYSSDHVCHHGFGFTEDVYVDRWPRIVAFTISSVILLLLAPWAVRAVVSVDRLLIRLLLGPTAGAERVAQLERTRARAVDDSAATLRRIERDLHDGAQARLVSVAMNVGLAREKLAEGGDPAEATRLLESAHTTAKQAIAELRDLARGIHPPVLDAGLDAALATLAANSPVPVTLDTAITERPEPAIETMTYFCVAELLTNVAKHSGATHVRVSTGTARGRLRIEVGDDGHGGARLGGGTGLSGLAERVATVDGHLEVHSPPGGPTLVTVDVPLRARAAT